MKRLLASCTSVELSVRQYRTHDAYGNQTARPKISPDCCAALHIKPGDLLIVKRQPSRRPAEVARGGINTFSTSPNDRMIAQAYNYAPPVVPLARLNDQIRVI